MAGFFFSYFRLFILYWGVADCQSCSGFWWTAKGLSHTYTCIHAGGCSGEEPSCQCRKHKRHGFHPWIGKIFWWRKWQPPPPLQYSCLDYPHGQRSWVGYSPWDLRVGHDWATKPTLILSQTPFPSRLARYWVKFLVLCNWLLLVIHFEYSSVYITFPNSLIIPSPNGQL